MEHFDTLPIHAFTLCKNVIFNFQFEFQTTKFPRIENSALNWVTIEYLLSSPTG